MALAVTVKGVGAHAVQQNAATGAHGCGEALSSSQKVFRIPGSRQQVIDIFAVFVLGNEKVAVVRVMRQHIIQGRGPDDAADGGMGTHILDPLSHAPHLASIVQALQVLFDCSDHTFKSFLGRRFKMTSNSERSLGKTIAGRPRKSTSKTECQLKKPLPFSLLKGRGRCNEQ